MEKATGPLTCWVFFAVELGVSRGVSSSRNTMAFLCIFGFTMSEHRRNSIILHVVMTLLAITIARVVNMAPVMKSASPLRCAVVAIKIAAHNGAIQMP